MVAAKAHYDFVLIHPFDDGNGRMARLLMNLILIEYGFPPAIVKTEDKANYFSALRQADGGQLEVFVEYIAGCVFASLEIMLARARGEEIDEFDVKARQNILALERLLVTRDTYVTATKSPETVANTIEIALLPLQAAVLHALQKFSALLVSINAEYHERTRDRGFPESYSYGPALSRDAMQGAAESGKLVMRVVLSGVRSVGLFKSQKSWDFVIAFFGDHLQVQCKVLELQLGLRYQTALSDDETQSVDQTVTKHTIRWLQDVTGIDVDKVLSG